MTTTLREVVVEECGRQGFFLLAELARFALVNLNSWAMFWTSVSSDP
jgi:hypothetical protein